MYDCLSHTPHAGDLVHNPGMFPDWELNWQPFCSQSDAQFTEPHQPGLVSSTDSIPAGFCSQKLWELIFLALESWARCPGVGLGLLASEIYLPNLYPPYMSERPVHSMFALLLPLWMDVVSLIP